MSVLPRPPSASFGRTVARSAKYYASGLGKALYTQPVFIWAQAIAFKVFITLLPLLLLATGVFGLVLRAENPFETVAGFLRGFLPAAQSEPLIQLVTELQSASGGLTIVGSTAFVVTVITLLSTVRYVIGTAMGGERHQMRSLLGGYGFDIRMALQVGSLFLISFGATLGVRLLRQYGEAWGVQPGILEGLGQLLTLIVPYAITLGMIVQLYYFIPQPRPPLRSAMWGSAAAAVLFEIAKNGFALYATYIGRFERYAGEGATDGLGGIGGAFGLLLAFVFWVYLSGLILVIGAIIVSLHEKRHRPRRSALRRLWRKFGTARRRPVPAEAPPEASGDGVTGADTPDPPEASQPEAPGPEAPEPEAPEPPAGDGGAAVRTAAS